MTHDDLKRVLEVAEKFAYDPEERVVFTGKSIRDILIHLRLEVENQGKSESEIISDWDRNVERFRELVVSSARRANSIVTYEGRTAFSIREEDAVAGTTQCPKGPNYHYPQRR